MGDQAPLEGPTARFRPLWLRTALLISGPGFLVMEALILAFSDRPVDQVALTVGGAAGLVAAFAWAGITVLFWRVRVGPQGICGGEFFGLGRWIRWEEVCDARPANVLGFRFLRVYVRGRSDPTLIPLFLHRFDEFADAVFSHAGPQNPVSAALVAYRGW